MTNMGPPNGPYDIEKAQKALNNLRHLVPNGVGCVVPPQPPSCSPLLKAVKHDGDKVRLDLLPLDALEEVGKVLTFGAKKYGDRNWELGFPYMRVVGAILRHLFAFVRGEDQDAECGLSHLACATCNCLFLLTFTLRKTGTDNRNKTHV